MMKIYDNTLREGLQNKLVCLNCRDKIDILKKQIEIGIRNIEIGFVAVSGEERNDIETLLKQSQDADLFCLARLKKADINWCYELGCKNVTIFVPSSDELIRLKMNKRISEIERDICNIVQYAIELGLKVRFSCEGATNTPIKRLISFYNLAEKYGAHTISVPDTYGIGRPSSIYSLITKLKRNTGCNISMHCHNDLGLATANALAGAEAGASEIQTTIYGVGERMGNTDLSEIIVIMKKYFDDNCGVDLKKLKELYHLFSQITKIKIRADKPIIGENQFVHESGLHARAVVQGSGYEAFPPTWIGEEHRIIYGEQSGLANIEYFCKKYSIKLNGNEKKNVLQKVKEISRQNKRSLRDDEMISIIGAEIK